MEEGDVIIRMTREDCDRAKEIMVTYKKIADRSRERSRKSKGTINPRTPRPLPHIDIIGMVKKDGKVTFIDDRYYCKAKLNIIVA